MEWLHRPGAGTGVRRLRRSRPIRRSLALLAIGALLPWPSLLILSSPVAQAATITSAVFTGGAGTHTSGGVLYAKAGSTLTLTVTAAGNTRCVDVNGAHDLPAAISGSAQTTWTFNVSANGGDGVHQVNITAGESNNGNTNNRVCTQRTATSSASYAADNTGPAVNGALSPAPNGAGWNKSDVTVNWTTADAGSGVKSGPTPATDSQTANTPGVTKTATATDNVGNVGNGSLGVKLDKTAPSIDATRSPAPNGAGWNNTNVTVGFTCSDGLSGIKSCTGGGSVALSTEGANQSVPGTAVDNADNVDNAGITGINIDKTAPSLSGAAAGAPSGTDDQGAEWYKDDVVVAWTASDALSGLAAGPTSSTVTGEGANLSVTKTVSDKAGNERTASAAVNIDRTAPRTDATAPSGWANTDQTVTLAAGDALSGVRATHYILDGGAPQTGTSVPVAGDGMHTLEYWSEDHAGNVEARKSVEVKVDGSAPTISHTQSPLANANGWNNEDVTVSFVCADAVSGIASCTSDQVVSTEGADQEVVGTATDNAGNTATDPASVSLDRTKPTITGTAARAANGNGWYDADVTVSFDCADALSGIDACSPAQILGEGAGQSATGSAKDAAGNQASDTVSGIDVDKTRPELSGEPTTSPNAADWYAGDVVIAWTCSDALSGIDGDCPGDSTMSGEGADLTASASVADKAGNERSATSPSVKIDRTAPVTTATVPEPLDSGWYAGPVKITLDTAADLSGVEKTYYSVDGGPAQAYGQPFDFGDKGIHTIAFWSIDNAGNVEDRTLAGHELMLKIDGIAPTISGNRQPLGNGFGWNNTDVSVSFECSDAESGIASCSAPVDVVNEGADQSVDGSAVDNAGNTASAKVGGINIDKTAPTLAGAPTTDANAAGWYKGDVTIAWTGQDGLSGIDPGTQPANNTISGEGADLGAGPISISDKAGNSTSASVSGIRIDRTAPVVSGGPTTQPNAAGWYGSEVTVAFSCTDNLSGVAKCPTDMLLSNNGANQSVTSSSAEDVAGNLSAGKTVAGINIDGLPPQTTADNQCTKVNGWCTGATANVVLNATDQSGLSGVKEIRYSVNGGSEQVAAGATKTVGVPLDGSGEATVMFYAVDKADNREPVNGVSLKYDNIAPMATHTLTPSPNALEWNNSNVKVHFDAKDNDGGSGVDASRTTPDVTVSDETAGREIVGEAYDIAGNRGTDKVTVKLDKSAPTVTGAIVDGTLGEDGWYVGPVKVHYTCSDALSGVVVCPDDEIVNTNGSNQSVSGTATDAAGNTATATVSGISIDREKPAITFSDTPAIQTLGNTAKPTCTAKDDVSGARSCQVIVTGGTANGVGTFTATATATDKAGNVSTATMTYRVIYKWSGFRQPITDTAHEHGAVSVFKSGATIPVKFQLSAHDGTAVKANTAGAWLKPVTGGLNLAAPTEQAFVAGTADTGLDYRWDDSGRQYIYNWQTPKGSANAWRIGVTLDDGQTYSVAIALR